MIFSRLFDLIIRIINGFNLIGFKVKGIFFFQICYFLNRPPSYSFLWPNYYALPIEQVFLVNRTDIQLSQFMKHNVLQVQNLQTLNLVILINSFNWFFLNKFFLNGFIIFMLNSVALIVFWADHCRNQIINIAIIRRNKPIVWFDWNR